MAKGGKTKVTDNNEIDAWSGGRWDKYAGMAEGLLGKPFQAYTGNLSAGQNQLETQAGQAVSGLLGFNPGQVSAKSFTDADMAAYQNPELESVINRSLQGVERNRQAQQVADNQAATAAGAFGGSRHGVRDSLTNAEFGRIAADTESNLRSQAFENAYGRWNADTNRSLQADQFNSTMGLNAANFGLGAAGLLGDLGSRQRQFEQEGLDRGYNEFLRGYDDNFRQLAGYSGLLNSVPIVTDGSRQQKISPSGWDIAGGALKGIGSIFSDARLKTAVQTLGYDERGRRWVEFLYKFDPKDAPPRQGVIAQEVRRIDPDLVSEGPGGFLTVDYDALGPKPENLSPSPPAGVRTTPERPRLAAPRKRAA